MRICAVSLPELRVEVARAADARLVAYPLAIVVAPAPMTEAKLLGNTRLDVVSREARALGVRPGQTIAQARARAPESLAVRVVRPDAVKDVLARLAEIALAFGATVAFGMERGDDDEASLGDVVWVDVTGCAHLFARGEGDDDGERVLATRLAGAFEAQGHACSVAIADGPRVAGMLARAGGGERLVVPPGKNAEAIASLGIASLPLPDADVRWLTKLGVRTIAELRALPRSGLATRLGARAPLVLALADGEDRAPLTPFVPPQVPVEGCELEYGVESTEALAFVAKTLCDRIAARLAGRAVAAARLELELSLDGAMLERGASEDAARDLLVLELPAPLSAAQELLAALRPKIERHALRAPVLAASLRAASLVHKREAARSLFEPQPKAERALPRLVAELVSDLGEDAVGKLALGDAWTPEDRSLFVCRRQLDVSPRRARGRDPTAGKPRHHLLSTVPEPTRILDEPVAVAREAVKIVRHLARVELADWWKQERAPGEPARRGADYVYAWTDDGPAWVEIDRGSSRARIRGWFD
jgi:protein ImuB